MYNYDISTCYPMNVVKGKKTTNPKHATKEQSEHAFNVISCRRVEGWQCLMVYFVALTGMKNTLRTRNERSGPVVTFS
jgi:beta-lactamase superfamily II metal-dependent hydrolase